LRSRAVLIAFIALIFALVLPSLASASVAGQFRVAIGSEATFSDPTLAAQHNEFIVLQAWEGQRATELKAINPNLKVLVYQDLAGMTDGTGPEGLSSSGVNYAEANTAHPQWFLLNTNSERIDANGYPWLWMADIGNVSYQEQWTANVLKLLSHGPWNGVMMDDTNTTARYDTNPSSIAEYPTDAAYQAAVGSMLAYAGPRIQAAGKLAIPNIGSWNEYPEVVERWLHYVSGGVEEMFAKWSTKAGEGYQGPAEWQTQIEEIQTTERMGKYFLAITQSEAGDTQAIRYGWASTLLGADGHTVYTAAANYTTETWSSEYEVPLGAPTSAAIKLTSGAWERSFADGLVVVNPTSSAIDVSFGGSYSGSGLTNATGATLGANSAVILARGARKSGEEGSETGTGTSSSGSSETSTNGTGSTGASDGGSSTSGSTGASSSAGSGSTGSLGGASVLTNATGGAGASRAPATVPASSGRHRAANRSTKATTARLRAAQCQRAVAARRRARTADRKRLPTACVSRASVRKRLPLSHV
jgi:Hypothetical glycosyl hydrolase family 15